MRPPGAAPGGAAPAGRAKLSWKRLLRDAFGEADGGGEGVKLKRMRKRACAAAEAQLATAGAPAPDRRALHATRVARACRADARAAVR